MIPANWRPRFAMKITPFGHVSAQRGVKVLVVGFSPPILMDTQNRAVAYNSGGS